MDFGIVAAILMLIVWGVAVFGFNNAPGYVHILLSGGLFLLIWRIAVRGAPMQRRVKPPN